jgi:hypothetical protein
MREKVVHIKAEITLEDGTVIAQADAVMYIIENTERGTK